MNKPLKINTLFSRGPLARLLGQVQTLSRLDQRLRTLLPHALAPHCRVLAIRDRSLILAADSPVWAMRLRFHIPQLQRRLTADFDSIRVRVLPPEQDSRNPARPGPEPRSRHSNETLRRAALTVSDPALKSALLRLADDDARDRGRD